MTPKQNFVTFKNDKIPQTASKDIIIRILSCSDTHRPVGWRQSRRSRRVALAGGGPRPRWALSPKGLSAGSSVVPYHRPERSFNPPLVDIPFALQNTGDLSPMQDIDPRPISLPVPGSGSHTSHQQRNEKAAHDEEGMGVYGDNYAKLPDVPAPSIHN
jgi:hypothetical protein